MFSKLVFVSALVALSLAAPQHQQAAQFPAGVSPQDCPGFPICDNARLHNPQARWGGGGHDTGHWNPGHDTGHWNPGHDSGHWQPQPQQHWGNPAPAAGHWQQPAPAWQPQPQGHWGAPAPGGADKFPAGVNPQSCPNYPFCDVNAGHHGAPVAAPPLPGWNERLYPAGVSPSQCPNFPYCH